MTEYKIILTGGQLNVTEKGEVEIPPKSAKEVKDPTIALFQDYCKTIQVALNEVVKDEQGNIVCRKDENGKILTGKTVKGSNKTKKSTTRESTYEM